MADTLNIFGTEYTDVAGIIATTPSETDLTYIRPQGTKSISANGTGIDVAEYASVDVSVSAPTPSLQTITKTYTPTESQQTETITAGNGYDGIEEVDVTVGAISTTYVGTGITRRSSSDLTASGATVTVPSGYYASNASKAVSSGSASPASTISATGASVSTGTNTLTLSKTVSNTPTVSAGYISSGTAGNSSVSLTASVTTQAAQTIYPSTSDQTINSGRYLTGNQSIKAVTTSNLTADNIKSGVTVTVGDSADADRILSVTGTYSGGGGANIATATMTNSSNQNTSIDFTLPSGRTPKAFFARLTSQIARNSNSRYYYVFDMRWDGSSTGGVAGNTFYMYNGTLTNVTSGYSYSQNGTTFTLSSTGSRSASPGSFYNGTYELVYVY